MNAVVRLVKQDVRELAAKGGGATFYRVDQDLEVPLTAVSLRFAVRDTNNNRIGAMEVALPMAPAAAPAAPSGQSH